jgi:hypothetical protein
MVNALFQSIATDSGSQIILSKNNLCVLKLNLLGNSMGHSVLGIDTLTNKFVPPRLLRIKNLNEQLLPKAVSSFFSTVSQLREKLAQFLQAQVFDTAFENPLAFPNLNCVI